MMHAHPVSWPTSLFAVLNPLLQTNYLLIINQKFSPLSGMLTLSQIVPMTLHDTLDKRDWAVRPCQTWQYLKRQALTEFQED